MIKRFNLYIVLSVLLSAFAVSCNSDDHEELSLIDDSIENAVFVKSFSLEKNDSVLTNLDSVFFSIDLERAVIFNADSLPKGTNVSKLVINLGLSPVSEAKITMPNAQGVDTIVDYLTNSTDSINFSKGSVKLHLISGNKEVERNYTIYVNVHNMEPDSLAWGNAAWTSLPTTLTAPTAQKTIEYQGKAVCFTMQDASVCRAVIENPENRNWDTQMVTLPVGAKIETITASTDALYLLDDTNMLYSSSDMGSTWSATSVSMTYIYGCMDSKVVGVRNDASGCVHVTYPSSVETAVVEDCPVEGTSPALVFSSEWSESAMLFVVGGRTLSGELTGATWAYDGQNWAKVSISDIKAVTGAMVVPYFAFKTATDWVVTKSSILLALGGISEIGEPSDVYMSYDRGVHWEKAPQLLQLPSEVAPGIGAQALVFNSTMGSRASNSWTDCSWIKIPSYYTILSSMTSRASKPIEEWECPYLY